MGFQFERRRIEAAGAGPEIAGQHAGADRNVFMVVDFKSLVREHAPARAFDSDFDREFVAGDYSGRCIPGKNACRMGLDRKGNRPRRFFV